MYANVLPDKSIAVFIAAPVFTPKVITIPYNIGVNTRGISPFVGPALFGSVIAAIAKVRRAVPNV